MKVTLEITRDGEVKEKREIICTSELAKFVDDATLKCMADVAMEFAKNAYIDKPAPSDPVPAPSSILLRKVSDSLLRHGLSSEEAVEVMTLVRDYVAAFADEFFAKIIQPR